MERPETLIERLPDCLHWSSDGAIRVVGHRIGLFHLIDYYDIVVGVTKPMLYNGKVDRDFPGRQRSAQREVGLAIRLGSPSSVLVADDRGLWNGCHDPHPLPESRLRTKSTGTAHRPVLLQELGKRGDAGSRNRPAVSGG